MLFLVNICFYEIENYYRFGSCSNWRPCFHILLFLCFLATLRVPGAESDDESKTPSASPRHGRSRPSSIAQESSSESEDGDSRGEVCYLYGQV